RHVEAHRQAVVAALDAALLDQAADAERLADRGLLVRNLCRAIEEHEVFLKCREHQRDRDSQTGQRTDDQHQSFVSRFHATPLRRVSLTTSLTAASRRTFKRQISTITTAAVIAKDPQTKEP